MQFSHKGAPSAKSSGMITRYKEIQREVFVFEPSHEAGRGIFVQKVDLEILKNHVTFFFASDPIGPQPPANAPMPRKLASIVSAMKIHTTLKKSSTKTIYYEKS